MGKKKKKKRGKLGRKMKRRVKNEEGKGRKKRE